MNAKSSTQSFHHFQRFIRIILTLSLIGIFLATFPSFADTTSQSSSGNSNSVIQDECGNRNPYYNVAVPFGDSPWNIPACDIPLFNNDEDLARDYGSRFATYAYAWNATDTNKTLLNGAPQPMYTSQMSNFMTQFGLAGDANDYSIPIYTTDASFYNPDGTLKPEHRKQIMLCNAATCLPSNLDKAFCWDRGDLTCMTPTTPIPWDSSWKPAGQSDTFYGDDANDREMIIVDYRNGNTYGLWQVDQIGGTCMGNYLWYSLGQRSPEQRMCVAAASITRDNTGKAIDLMKYNQGVASERGMGIQNRAMIVTPEEVAGGEIRHALTAEILNTMTGPVCSPSQLATENYDIIGKTCGYAVAPATVVEWGEARDISRAINGAVGECSGTANMDSNPDPNVFTSFKDAIPLSQMIPEGMRFRLQWDNGKSVEQNIEEWLDSKALEDPTYAKDNDPNKMNKRDTARVFAIALADYGWIVGDTTCNGAGFNIAGSANPKAKQIWASVGINDASSQRLLKGLITKDNTVALQPPVSTCNDGKGTKTRFFCPWLTSKYDGIDAGSVIATTTPTTIPTTTTTLAPTTTKAVTTTTTTKPVVTTTTKPPTTTTVPPTTKGSTGDANSGATPVTTPPIVSVVDNVKPVGPSSFRQFEMIYNGWAFQPCSWITNCRITMTWPAATDNKGIESYEVTRTFGTQVTKTTLKPNVTSYTDTTVNAGYSYTYKVTAKDASGNVSTGYTKTASINCLGFFCNATYR